MKKMKILDVGQPPAESDALRQTGKTYDFLEVNGRFRFRPGL